MPDRPAGRLLPGLPVEQCLAELDGVLDAVDDALAQVGDVALPAERIDHHPGRRDRPGELDQPGGGLPRPLADLGHEVAGLLPPARLARRIGPGGLDPPGRGATGRPEPLAGVGEQGLGPGPVVGTGVGGRRPGEPVEALGGARRVVEGARGAHVGVVRPDPAGPGLRGGLRVLPQGERGAGAALRVTQHPGVGLDGRGGGGERLRRVVEAARLEVDHLTERVAGRAHPLAGVDGADPGGRAAETVGDGAAARDQPVELRRPAWDQLGDGGPRGQPGHRCSRVTTTPRRRAPAGRTAGCGPAGSTTRP